MYKINKKSKLTVLWVRGIFLSKKYLKKNRKSTLIYLISPKHFNIGKHRVFSFSGSYSYRIPLNINIPTIFILKNQIFFFKILEKFYNFKTLFRFNSLRVTGKTKIKF